MLHTRIKICGITRPEDAAQAAELGVDAIGLNFVKGPRKIDPRQGRAILDVIPPLITAVALCRGFRSQDKTSPGVWDLLEGPTRLPCTVFQVYGDFEETAGKSFDLPPAYSCWPVFHIDSRELLLLPASGVAGMPLRGIWPRRISALLLDTASSTHLGGTGQSFNWHWIAEARAAGELDGLPPIILAGGLTPANVAKAIRIAQPYAVDVSSGVEVPGKPGIKDPLKMRDFIQAVRQAA